MRAGEYHIRYHQIVFHYEVLDLYLHIGQDNQEHGEKVFDTFGSAGGTPGSVLMLRAEYLVGDLRLPAEHFVVIPLHKALVVLALLHAV
jgi:hypothetical protein